MTRQIVNKPFLHSRRVDAVLKGPSIIQSDILKEDSLIFIDGVLLMEGIDNDYSLNGQEIEIHVQRYIYLNKNFSIIRI